jgi:alpha-2-macroglobulin
LRAHLQLGLNPFSKITPGLKYLLSYPYGCVEQTSSQIIPLAALRKLAEQGVIPGLTLPEVDTFLQPGLVRLLKMQTTDGGFGYWPGDYETSWWGTQYAVLALTIAERAGCDVPHDRLDAAMSYLKKEIGKKSDSAATYNYGITAMVAVNLALHDKLTAEEFEALAGRFRDRDRETRESEMVLAWAAAILKHPSAEAVRKTIAGLNPRIPPGEYTWYRSESRSHALALLAALEGDPASKRADEFAGEIIKRLGPDGRWQSTADTGLCLFALGLYFERTKPQTTKSVEVTVTQPGRPAKTVKVGETGLELELDAEALLENPTLTLKGNNKAMVSWSLNTVYPEAPRTEDECRRGFVVDKTITNLNGQKEIRVGDLVKVVVDFESELSRKGRYGRFEHVALEDPLPAGFIAINSALRTEGRVGDDDEDAGDNEEWYTPWEDGAYLLRPTHGEIHDDRVLAFKDSIWSGRFRFTYYARAVCEGTFRLRPTRVSLMYDPDFLGLTPGDTVTILPQN